MTLDTLLLALTPVLSVGVILWMRRRTRRRLIGASMENLAEALRWELSYTLRWWKRGKS